MLVIGDVTRTFLSYASALVPSLPIVLELISMVAMVTRLLASALPPSAPIFFDPILMVVMLRASANPLVLS